MGWTIEKYTHELNLHGQSGLLPWTDADKVLSTVPALNKISLNVRDHYFRNN